MSYYNYNSPGYYAGNPGGFSSNPRVINRPRTNFLSRTQSQIVKDAEYQIRQSKMQWTWNANGGEPSEPTPPSGPQEIISIKLNSTYPNPLYLKQRTSSFTVNTWSRVYYSGLVFYIYDDKFVILYIRNTGNSTITISPKNDGSKMYILYDQIGNSNKDILVNSEKILLNTDKNEITIDSKPVSSTTIPEDAYQTFNKTEYTLSPNLIK